MTEINRLEFPGVHHQASETESYHQPFSMYGHFFSATYFTAVLPTQTVAQNWMTCHQPDQNRYFRSTKTSDSLHQRHAVHPSNPSCQEDVQYRNNSQTLAAGRVSQCSVTNVSPTSQLCLPTIRTSYNVAENVMMEESDLGYNSWSENTPLDRLAGLDELDLSSGSDDVFDDIQSNFSDIIDEMIGGVDESTEVSTQIQIPNETVADTRTCTHFFNIPAVTQPVFKSSFIEISSDVSTAQFLRRVEERKVAPKQPLRCPLCSKQFTNKTNLQVHIRMHTNIRPHKCPHCEKSFSQKSTLRTHIRTHTGEKPYVCSHCARAFSDYSTFRKHQRVHSGEKPYICDICNKAFAQSGNMIRHKQTHVKNNEVRV